MIVALVYLFSFAVVLGRLVQANGQTVKGTGFTWTLLALLASGLILAAEAL